MKRYFISLLLAIVSGCLIAFGCACSKGKTPETVLRGFTFASDEIEVVLNAAVMPETPFVLKENGEPVDVLCEVNDADGNYVLVNGGTFIASNPKGYTLRYVANDNGKILAEKIIKIKVRGAAFSIQAEYDEYIDVGQATEIQVNTVEGATLSYKVTTGDTEVAVDGNVFTPTTKGNYTVQITAEKEGLVSEYSYETYARTPSLKGEVETFGDDWTELSNRSTVSRTGWSRMTTEQTQLKHGGNDGEQLLDRFGEEGEFLTLTTSGKDEDSNKYINFKIDPRNELDYYKQLAKEGYDYLSVWVYLDSEYDHANLIYCDPAYSWVYYISGTSKQATGTSNTVLFANQWTEIRFGLQENLYVAQDVTRNFIGAYPYYKDGINFIRIDNTGYGKCDVETGSMSIYVASVFAVREKVEAVVDLSAGYDIQALLDENGTLYNDGEYTFKLYESGKAIAALTQVGRYDLDVKVYKNGAFYETRSLDLSVVDSTKPTTFLEIDSSRVHVVQYGAPKDEQLSIVSDPMGKTGQYFKVEYAQGENEEFGLKVLPSMSKVALEKYRGSKLRFDFYNGTASTKLHLMFTEKWKNTHAAEVAITPNAWNTIFLSVDVLLEYYDLFQAEFDAGMPYGDTTHAGKLFGLPWNTNAGEFYFGNFQILGLADMKDTGVDYEEFI